MSTRVFSSEPVPGAVSNSSQLRDSCLYLDSVVLFCFESRFLEEDAELWQIGPRQIVPPAYHQIFIPIVHQSSFFSCHVPCRYGSGWVEADISVCLQAPLKAQSWVLQVQDIHIKLLCIVLQLVLIETANCKEARVLSRCTQHFRRAVSPGCMAPATAPVDCSVKAPTHMALCSV